MKLALLFTFVVLALGQDACDFVCTDEWDPVCGSDDVTYSNKCELELADCLSDGEITLAHNGECGSECPEEWVPVCGTDGVTQANLCFLELASAQDDDLQLAYPGECLPPIEDVVAPCEPAMAGEDCGTHVYSPLCEVSGTTYRTLCDLCQAMYLAQAGGENIIYVVDHLGPCEV
ncbi:four-domain proteases inhibitor-like [Penaeus monodon]|uniref:four-domain proteases inhibitor-like n=1 Tax=Penaeus monodon TaxID=6687 RepID=UPI0018A6EC33|nr:four-domain proteases inhibitor-like [Penaeus monodon]